ncbi:DUF2510 domain-containing protein [Rathayibacter soli]|uniref:DUF2510 domain-containing protein n=1 Tax=Rathayibacter soli TaxID=3144168 RepID=UPI0027E487F6|nr:DUF2510 domain-containing protein [Glaciibacter superstes]
MSDVNGSNPAPGWYPDPAGSPQQRWWDGTQWTGYLQNPQTPAPPVQPPAVQPPPVQQTPAAPQQQPYLSSYADAAPVAQPYATVMPIVQPDLGPNPKIYTPFLWIIVLLPLLEMIAFAAFDLNKYAHLTTAAGPTSESFRMAFDPAYLLIAALGWVIYGVSAWLAYLDWHALGRVGVTRPFHWAWSFLPSGAIVYVIGRSVVVRRRVGKGLTPIWVLIGVYVITIVVVIIKVASFVNTVMGQIGTINGAGIT